MKIIKNIQIKGKHQRPILADLAYNENQTQKKVVVFCHGYKGYKDWGAWDLVAQHFAKRNFFFLKMNFSHNGGTVEQPIDFPDLEAFGQNNFIKELDDLNSVIDWVFAQDKLEKEINTREMSLIGHSRGGGIVLLKTARDDRIKNVISWAGVSDFASRFPSGEVLDQWRKNGVAYVANGRTNQQMPHYFQFYTSFKENEASLNIRNAVNHLTVPYLILHGKKDETVPLKEAENLNSWSDFAQLKVLDEANHTFGSSQPWKEAELPKDLKTAVEYSLDFLS